MSFLSRLIDRRIEAYQSQLLKTHYDEVENMYRQMRAWRHDTRNHIQVLSAYAQQGDLPAITAYLQQLGSSLDAVDPALKTGNKMADAILNSKISLAHTKHIAVSADAHIPLALKTSDIDLCALIGNLFDNAIEASLALPEAERMIRVYMVMKNTQLYMSFTNKTSNKKQMKENGRFRTTKGEGHGFGLVRVDSIVERYGGYLKRASEDGAFTTEILLPQ